MTLSQGLPGEAALWQALIKPVKELMQDALSKAGIPEEDVHWMEMRWDTPDITASWPKYSPNRNIHAWITGRWPRFTLDVEGAVWEDDQEKLERRVRFFSLRDQPGAASLITVSGLASQPVITIIRRSELFDELIQLANNLKSTNLDNGASIHPLQPDPRSL